MPWNWMQTMDHYASRSEKVETNENEADATKEKLTRGAIKAAVERSVTKEVTVIVDSLNYIKGYRYELYCLARAATTPHLVIYCETPKESILEWNQKRDSGKWDETMYVHVNFILGGI